MATFVSDITIAERERIRVAVLALSQLSPLRSFATLVLDWVVIALAIWIGTSAASSTVVALCVLVIGSRQHGLLLLMHDAAHRRFHPNADVNDWLSDLFCAYPLFVTTDGYRASHFAHHRHTNTDLDPDWIRRVHLTEWNFPKSRHELTFLLLKQISGFGFGGMVAKALRFGGTGGNDGRPRRPSKIRLMARVAFYGSLAAALTISGRWTTFLLFWVLPIATALAFFMRVRSVSEHFGLSRRHELTSSRNVVPGAVEGLLFGLHSSHFHLDHHLYPSVPFYRLAKLHDCLMKNDFYCREAKLNLSYFARSGPSLWRDLVTPKARG